MDWNATLKNVGIRGILVLLVFIVGPAFTSPAAHFHSPVGLENVEPITILESSASTAEVFRNIKTILSVTRPIGNKRKIVKQEAEATDGAANALAYLTDSFGGQLAGQILSLILSSVTGDVRGILGNSVNLFQTDESRDRVQLFLDDISSNFLKFTGLSLLVTTKSPLQQSTPYPGAPVLIGNGQTQAYQPSQSYPVSSLGSGLAGSAFAPASASIGGGGLGSTSGGIGGGASGIAGGFGGTALATAGLLPPQQKPQQATPAQQPIIYVLPQLGNTGTTGSGTTGTKATGSKVTSNSNTEDDSEEEDLISPL